ncbi:Palmitoyl-protein thioesterase [Spironucleus salmonicida]|uniref:Palmitoyl-protein thioesterase n=1 Tax=Spironucleus salmonicida TaxID=348837 RepID=V6LDL5_9EUKA|nr:Palmitoyl-protein thioesterase [Spironucleus salmonicida]|eukprot:EST41761.1 Palmitoyl-protein thioesterase [Spironucleus salmonicida]
MKHCTIILIHGMLQSTLSMSSLQNNLEQQYPDRKIRSIPILLGPLSTIFEDPSYYLTEISKQIQKEQGCVDIIGHSLGGFFARAYSQLYGDRTGYPQIRKLISTSGVQGGFYCKNGCFGIPKFLLSMKRMNSRYYQENLIPAHIWRDYKQDLSVQKGFITQIMDVKIKAQEYICFWTEADDILQPPETGKHGFYNKNGTIVDAEDLEEFQMLGLDQMKNEGRFTRINMVDYLHNDYLRDRSKEFVEEQLSKFL